MRCKLYKETKGSSFPYVVIWWLFEGRIAADLQMEI